MKNQQVEPVDDLLLVTFTLGEGLFGIDADLVQEAVKVSVLTPVHHAPAYVLGIRNLRGRVVSVFDLRVRLGLGSSARSAENRVLIIDWQGEPIGLLVDRVEDTFSVAPQDIEAPPQNLHAVQQANLVGVSRQGGRLVAILAIAAVLGVEAGDC